LGIPEIQSYTWDRRPLTFAAALTDATNKTASKAILEAHRMGTELKIKKEDGMIGAIGGEKKCFFCESPQHLRDVCPWWRKAKAILSPSSTSATSSSSTPSTTSTYSGSSYNRGKNNTNRSSSNQGRTGGRDRNKKFAGRGGSKRGINQIGEEGEEDGDDEAEQEEGDDGEYSDENGEEQESGN
jgi:hypothetical protein